MIRIEVKNKRSGITKQLDLPSNAMEVKLIDFLKFDIGYKSLNSFIVENMKEHGDDIVDDIIYRSHYGMMMTENLSTFFGIHMNELTGMEVGELKDLFENDTERKTLTSLSQLEGIVSTAIKSYEPIVEEGKYYRFKHKNLKGNLVTWSIPKLTKDEEGSSYFTEPPIDQWQGIELLEVRRLIETDENKANHKEADLQHTMLCRTLAILATHHKEKIPVSIAGKRRYLDQKAKLFEDINMQYGLTARFFLKSIMLKSGANRFSSGILTHQNQG